VRNKQDPQGSAKPPLDADQIEMLMVRRRDSMSYTEFIRGKYDASNTAYLKKLLENMTTQERERLTTLPFDTLWDRLWGHQDRHGNDYHIAKQRFEALNVKSLVQSTNTVYHEPEWGFPKGRRMRCETDVACAEREFFEETNIEKECYVLVQDVVFKESFTGTNGVAYEHKYMLAFQKTPIDIHRKFTPLQHREISAIGWRSIAECSQITRPHYTGRNQMLISIVKLLQTIEIEKIPPSKQ
jgi:8-oxo-dGTP pyrophosphatase MutT (NUDIX family)